MVPTLVTWIIGNIYNRTLPQKTKIPEKNSLICGVIVFVSTITYTWATAMTSFPVVMAFKSCNILSILLVAILCTRVKDKKLKLGPKKIIVGVVISVGVFLFSYFDPEQADRTQQSQVLGIVLLFVSLLADGFLPDFQAEIKS
jgi:drug/metabolite transporter (DMT)-like permease